MIEHFIRAGERYSSLLSEERRLDARATSENAESTVERLLAMQRDRCGIRNELDAMAKETCAEVVRLGGDPATVTRATVAAWNYVNRWHDVWFETRSHLTALLLQHDTPIDYVTLRQCAGIVNKNKRTLERWKEKDTAFPTPEIIGENGEADEWSWATIRPYLETKASRKLPEIFPAHIAR